MLSAVVLNVIMLSVAVPFSLIYFLKNYLFVRTKVIMIKISKGARKLVQTNVMCKDHFCDKAPPAVRGIVIRFIPTLPIFHFRQKKFSFVEGQSFNGWM
jgi:hypothetical protein